MAKNPFKSADAPKGLDPLEGDMVEVIGSVGQVPEEWIRAQALTAALEHRSTSMAPRVTIDVALEYEAYLRGVSRETLKEIYRLEVLGEGAEPEAEDNKDTKAAA